MCQGSRRPQPSLTPVRASDYTLPHTLGGAFRLICLPRLLLLLSDLNILEGTGGHGGEGLSGRGPSWLGLESWLLPKERTKCTGHVPESQFLPFKTSSPGGLQDDSLSKGYLRDNSPCLGASGFSLVPESPIPRGPMLQPLGRISLRGPVGTPGCKVEKGQKADQVTAPRVQAEGPREETQRENSGVLHSGRAPGRGVGERLP